ncbi:MAG: hypothetical protein V1708_02970 [Candidatus Micrarchaeota archaeon]
MDAQGIRDWFEETFSTPESRGIAVLAVLLLATFAIAFFVAMPFLKPPKLSSLEVKVTTSSGEAVAGAAVRLYDSTGSLLDEQKSDSAGIARFENVPQKAIVRAFASGYLEGSALASGDSVSLELERDVSALPKISFSVRVIDSVSTQPIANAVLTYSAKGGKQGQAKSDSAGKATLQVPEGKVIGLKATHPDYEPKSASFLAKKRLAAMEINLVQLPSDAPRTAIPDLAGPAAQFGSLEVTVSDEEGSPVIGASVEAFEAETSFMVDNQTSTAQGKAFFPELSTQTRVFLVVKAQGFVTLIGRQKILVTENSKTEVVLRREGAPAKSFKVISADESGVAVAGEIRVYSLSQNQLIKRSASSSSELSVSVDDIKAALGDAYSESDSYYAAASAQGRLPAASEAFSEPFIEDISLNLLPAADSATLSLSAVDSSRAPLSSATLRVAGENGMWLYDTFGASKDFALSAGRKYRLEAESGGEKGFGRILLSRDADYAIWLGEMPVFLLVSGVDAISGKAVQADFTSLYSGEEHDSCSGSPCYLRLKRFSTASVKAFAAKYEEYQSAVEVTAEDEREVQIPLVASAAIEGAFVKLSGVTDSLGMQVKSLSAGESYKAKFLLASKNAVKSGIMFRVGTAASSDDDIAYITGFESSQTPSLTASSTAYDSSAACTPSTGSIVADAKWAYLVFDGTNAQEVGFKFALRAAVKDSKNLKLFYRAFSIKADGTSERFPKDSKLANTPDAPSGATCYAESLVETLPVGSETEFKCKQLGCVSLSLEQDGLSGQAGFQARTIEDCDATCADCDNSCDFAKLFVSLQFEPDPKLAGDEFEFRVTQSSGKVEFKQLSVGATAPIPVSSASLSGAFVGQKSYAAAASSVPMQEGDEAFTAEVWKKGQEDNKASFTVPFSILASCGAHQRRCQDGSCAMLCFSGQDEPTPTVPPAPECPAGETYCTDAICRVDCGAFTPPGHTPKNCVSNYECPTSYCDMGEYKCKPRPCTSASSCPGGARCTSGFCVPPACTPADPCGTGLVCNPSGVCSTPPKPCEGLGECLPGTCDQANNYCLYANPTPSVTPEPVPCTAPEECGSYGCNTAAGYCNNPPEDPGAPVPCTDPSQCASGECDEGSSFCVPPQIELPPIVDTPYVPDPGLSIDIVNGELRTSLTEIVFTSDAIFPADAVTLRLTPKCRRPLLGFQSTAGTEQCYRADATTISFRSSALAAGCPLSFDGQTPPSDTSAVLKVSCSGDARNTLSIPIRVTADSSIPAVYASPLTLEGSSSKIFHIVSETQGQRKLRLNDIQPADFQASDAQSFAWSGDGLLSVTENDGLAAEVNYNPTDTYFPGISDQGPRVESCSDFLCCAQGWCTTSAAGQAFNAFKAAADSVARRTVFKRSLPDGLPLKAITDKPFVYSTVMRLTQGANLPAIVRKADRPTDYGCIGDNPSVWVVQASTKDGITWDYVARVSRLYKWQYVSPGPGVSRCPVSPSTPALTATEIYAHQQSGGFLALCDFIAGNGDCPFVTPTAGIPNLPQVHKNSQQKPIPGISTFWNILLINRQICLGLTVAATTAFNLCMLKPVPTVVDCEAAGQAICKGGSFIGVDITAPIPPKLALQSLLPFPRLNWMNCQFLHGPPTGSVCMPMCTPSQDYIYFLTLDNHMYGVFHLGLTKMGCTLDPKRAALVPVTIAAFYVYHGNNYQNYLKVVQKVYGLFAFAIAGDFSTCAKIGALISLTPQQYQAGGSALTAACEVIASKSWKSLASAGRLGGGSTPVLTNTQIDDVYGQCMADCGENPPKTCTDNCWKVRQKLWEEQYKQEERDRQGTSSSSEGSSSSGGGSDSENGATPGETPSAGDPGGVLSGLGGSVGGNPSSGSVFSTGELIIHFVANRKDRDTRYVFTLTGQKEETHVYPGLTTIMALPLYLSPGQYHLSISLQGYSGECASGDATVEADKTTRLRLDDNCPPIETS